ncbi:hypothetical protein [Alkaliphilus transvaalensis]|uniref:hypothetical protein n=1 Tax=Alkaliphilus transvaalensis TaxID=114628 RepID=UPI00047CFF0B|nr:hypothetical protein [Alkaliphilus transvaalensis]
MFSVDFIITLAVFLIVTLVVGKRQVKLLLYTTPIYGITSIITGYLANPSIIIVMVSVILGVGITLFLYDYYMYEYDFVS